MDRSMDQRGVSMQVKAVDFNCVGVSMTVAGIHYEESTGLKQRSNQSIDRLGTPIQVIRNNQVVCETKGVLSPLQRISSAKTLSIIREAWFNPDDGIQAGDYIYDMNRGEYFIFLAQNEYTTAGETVVVASIVALCNHVVELYRIVDKPTGVGGVIQKFEMIENNIPVSVEFIGGRMRESEPGFFGTSTHRIFIPAYTELFELDRIKVRNDFLKVDAIDTISFENVNYCSTSRDRR